MLKFLLLGQQKFQDETPGIEPALHAIKNIPNYEWLLPFGPSPLRNVDDIEGIFKFCKENNSPLAVSVCDVNKHPNHMCYKDDTFSFKTICKK